MRHQDSKNEGSAEVEGTSAAVGVHSTVQQANGPPSVDHATGGPAAPLQLRDQHAWIRLRPPRRTAGTPSHQLLAAEPAGMARSASLTNCTYTKPTRVPDHLLPTAMAAHSLHQFYQRYKGHNSVGFARVPAEGAVPRTDTGRYHERDMRWRCNITLSGGRINDTTPLPTCSLEADARGKKEAEVAAHEAAVRHLTALGFINEATTAPSEPHTKWLLPRRRKEGSPLVFLDLEVGSSPGGRVVVELFEDLLPQTTARLLTLFQPQESPSSHSQGYKRPVTCLSGAGATATAEALSFTHAHVRAVVPRLGVQLSAPPVLISSLAALGSSSAECGLQHTGPFPQDTALAAAGGAGAHVPVAGGGGADLSTLPVQESVGLGAASKVDPGEWEDVLDDFLSMQEGGMAGEVEGGMSAPHQMAPAGADLVRSDVDTDGESTSVHQSIQAAVAPMNPAVLPAVTSSDTAARGAVAVAGGGEETTGPLQSTGPRGSIGPLGSGTWDGQGPLVATDEAGDPERCLPLERVFRVLALVEGGPAHQAALVITTHPAPQLAGSHLVVGQVVRGHGSVRALQQVPTDKRYQPLVACSVVGCGMLPRDTCLTSVPCLMDGAWPAWPDDLAPAGMHPPDGKSEAEWRCDLANEIRCLGNEAFRANDWEAAHRKYTQALRYLDWTTLHQLSELSYTGKKAMQGVEHALRLNRAAAAVHMGRGTAALEDVRAVMARIDPTPKALFRMAQALSVLQRYDEAVGALRRAVRLLGLEPDVGKYGNLTSSTAAQPAASNGAASEILAALVAAEDAARTARQVQGAAYVRALSQSGACSAVNDASGHKGAGQGTHGLSSELRESQGHHVEGQGREEGPLDAVRAAARLHANALGRMFSHLPCPGIQLSRPTP